jgi:hypothetical protein
MNGKCEIHHNQTCPVFYGIQHCVKVWKDLVERTLNIVRKPKKSFFSKRKRAITQEW